MKQYYKFVSFILFAGLLATAQAQSKLPAGTAAVVNGSSISDSSVDEAVRANVARGQKDSPQLRKAVVDSLVNRELLAQDALKRGLDKTPEAKQQLSQLRQNLLVELALADNLQKSPVTNQAVRAEYDRQIAALGNTSSLEELKLALIMVPTEADIKAVSAALKKGESFSKLAQEKSIDPSKSQGGNLGWVLSNQLNPAITNAIKAMPKNASLTAPVQGPAGWMLVKVEDKRNFKVPSFEESQERIRNGLLQNEQANYLAGLKAAAKITE
jgi:peptidyl-prolyl cis-trans isomerase C